jgi:eukaryotic-like serine/threonine-protein kinase
VRGLLSQVTNTPPTGTMVGPGFNGGTAMLATPHAAPPTLRQNRPSKTRRSLMAGVLVAIVLAAAAGGWFLGRGLLDEEQPVDAAKGVTMTYGKGGGTIPEFALGNGACPTAQLKAGHSYPSSSNSACDDPHEFEVVAADFFGSDEFDYPAGTLRAFAESACALLFASDVVAAADKDRALRYVTLLPTRQSWDDAANDDNEDGGNRSVYCLITSRQDGEQLQERQLREE